MKSARAVVRDLFHEHAKVMVGFYGLLDRPRTSQPAAATIAEETGRFAGLRSKIDEG